MRRVLVVLGLLAFLSGCGGGGTKTVTITTTVPATTAPPEKTSLRVYFLKDGRVQPVAREVPKTEAVAQAALDALHDGPTAQERRDLKLTSPVWSGVPPVHIRAISNGVAITAGEIIGEGKAAHAQLVYTLTQFPTVKAVADNPGSRRYTRADFEDETPIIAVESPLPFQHVTSPLRATGTANTFEATFMYELKDAHGTVIATHFVTATSGSGQRGTFDFTVPFTIDRPGLGKLVVFERSAANGQRIHENEIPVYLEP